MVVKRRFPNFFSGYEKEKTEHEVSSYEELMEIDWIKSYNNDIPGWMGMYYSPNDSKFEPNPDHLMSLSKDDNGKVIYFVVGYIFGDGKELGLENYLNYIG